MKRHATVCKKCGKILFPSRYKVVGHSGLFGILASTDRILNGHGQRVFRGHRRVAS